MKTVDERLVKVSMAQIPVTDTLELGDTVRVMVEGDVTKIEHKDNQDGTYNEVYVIKGIYGETIKTN